MFIINVTKQNNKNFKLVFQIKIHNKICSFEAPKINKIKP